MIYNTSPEGEARLSVSKVNRIVDDHRDKRSKETANWRVAKAFYEGDNFVRINRKTGYLNHKLAPEHSNNPWRVRIPVNQIKGPVDTLTGKLTQQRPTFVAQVVDNSLSSRRARKMAEALFDQKASDMNFAHKFERIVNMGLVFGEGWAEIFWNHRSGKKETMVIDPETGDEAVGARLNWLKQIAEADPDNPEAQLKTEERPIGDIEMEYLTPFEVIPLGSRDPRNSTGIVKVKGYEKDEAYKRWPLLREKKVTPQHRVDPDLGNPDDENVEVIEIRTLYWLPDDTFPQGKFMVWAGELVLEDGDYPYAHNKLPFIRFAPSLKVGSEEARSETWELVPLQKQYDRTVGQILEHQALTINPQILAPRGSLQEEVSSEPAAVIEYNVVGGAKPEWREMPSIPSYVGDMLDRIVRSMQDIIGVSDISQGKFPDQMTRMDSSFAMEAIDEKSETRMLAKFNAVEQFQEDAGNLILSLAQHYYTRERLVKVPGTHGVAEAVALKNTDLANVESIRVKQGSSKARSMAAAVSQAKELLDGGHITMAQFVKMANVANADEVMRPFVAAAEKQQREIDLVTKLAPEGEQPPELQAPTKADKHEMHMEVLEALFDSEEWDEIDSMRQQILYAHWEAHEKMLSEKMAEPPKAPDTRVQLALQAMATPEERARILGTAGTEIDEQALEEQEMGRMAFEARQEATGGSTIDPMADKVPTQPTPDVGGYGGGGGTR